MAIQQTEEVEVVEEIVDGKIRKVRRTIKKTIEEEIIEEVEPDPEPETEPEPEPIPEVEPEPEPEPTPEVESDSEEVVIEAEIEVGPGSEPPEDVPTEEPEIEPEPVIEIEPEIPVEETALEEVPTSIASRLICQCQSPSGLMSTGLAKDNGDGTFTLDVNATEPGIHRVMIFLDGKAIPGSPFCVRILQSAVKEQVHMYGPGLESGIIANVDGTIHIDTTGAGPGELNVNVCGPTGGYTVSLTRDKEHDRIVHVNYNPTLPGIYTMNVSWNNEHIAGSPHEFFISPNSAILHTWYEDPIKYKQILGL